MSGSAPPSTRVRAFLSCSIRRADRPLVGALVRYVLEPLGFDCVTVGRNVSRPDQVDDVIRQCIDGCHCLIGIATRRFVGTDAELPDRTLMVATPYLLQETAAAHQAHIPFLIVKTPGVALQGITARNLYLEVEEALSPRGRVQFTATKELVLSSLRDLKLRAEARSRERQRRGVVDGLKTATALAGAGYSVLKLINWMRRPDCFGDFYYRDRECQNCVFRVDCKAEKARQ